MGGGLLNRQKGFGGQPENMKTWAGGVSEYRRYMRGAWSNLDSSSRFEHSVPIVVFDGMKPAVGPIREHRHINECASASWL